MRIDPQELFTPPRAWFTLALFVITQLKQLASVQQKATEDAVKQLCSISFLETRLRKAASIVSVGCSWRYSSIAFEGIPITKMPTISDRIPLVRVKWHSRDTRGSLILQGVSLCIRATRRSEHPILNLPTAQKPGEEVNSTRISQALNFSRNCN